MRWRVPSPRWLPAHALAIANHEREVKRKARLRIAPLALVVNAFAGLHYAALLMVMRGLAELRVKESDRLTGTAEGLTACGVRVAVEGDDLIVEGSGNFPPGGATISTRLDHRMAMAFAVAALAARGPSRIDGADAVGISYPDFFPTLERLVA